MTKWKRFMSMGLAMSMLVYLTGCGGSAAEDKTEGEKIGAKVETMNADSEGAMVEQVVTGAEVGEKRIINIGSWWLQYYDSSHSSVEDDSSYMGQEALLLKFENVAKIEETYNCEFYWQNLTYAGVQESMNSSILMGDPDCDIYLVDLSFGIPAALNGLALDLKTVVPEEHDLFTTQNNMQYLDLGDGKACILKRVEAAATVEATYPLAYNRQLLEESHLEDPRELYARGEWTWDKFVEYCKILTQDKDADGQIDQYGYCGFINDTFEQLLMSNGANVAAGKTEELSSTETGQTLQMIYDMYNTYQICYPYDFENDDSAATMRGQYREGNIAFFPMAAWIAGDGADYDYNHEKGVTLPFDTVYVQWPVGPSGNALTNAGKVSAGEYYIIANGVEDPETVFNVLYDMWNWYGGDTSIRDDEETLRWWYSVTAKDEVLQKENFDVMYDVGSRETFELWNSLGIGYDFSGILRGDVTPEQFQEMYRNQVQDALDVYFD